MNLTINSTIIQLSVHACNFVLKLLHREEPGARVWPKLDVKITTPNSHFSKFHYIHLPSCITSIPIPLFTLVTQLSNQLRKIWLIMVYWIFGTNTSCPSNLMQNGILSLIQAINKPNCWQEALLKGNAFIVKTCCCRYLSIFD